MAGIGRWNGSSEVQVPILRLKFGVAEVKIAVR